VLVESHSISNVDYYFSGICLVTICVMLTLPCSTWSWRQSPNSLWCSKLWTSYRV